jgi:hypothetical protein
MHNERSLTDRLRHRLGALTITDIDRHRCAALVQTLRGRESKAARRTGDDGDTSREIRER